jgi:hypothetical protein
MYLVPFYATDSKQLNYHNYHHHHHHHERYLHHLTNYYSLSINNHFFLKNFQLRYIVFYKTVFLCK